MPAARYSRPSVPPDDIDGFTVAPGSVSYTHLDVYKRQGECQAGQHDQPLPSNKEYRRASIEWKIRAAWRCYGTVHWGKPGWRIAALEHAVMR